MKKPWMESAVCAALNFAAAVTQDGWVLWIAGVLLGLTGVQWIIWRARSRVLAESPACTYPRCMADGCNKQCGSSAGNPGVTVPASEAVDGKTLLKHEEGKPSEVEQLRKQLELVSTNLKRGMGKSMQKLQARAIDEVLQGNYD